MKERHIHRLIVFIVCFLWLVIPFDLFGHDKEVDSESVASILKQLNQELRNRDVYLAVNNQRADSLKALIRPGIDDSRRLALLQEVIDAYSLVSTDSVIKYCGKGVDFARQCGDSIIAQRFRLICDMWLPAKGIVKEAVEDFEVVREDGVYDDNRVLYYNAGCRMFYTISKFYPSSVHAGYYSSRAILYADSLLAVLPSGYPLRQMIEGLVFASQRDFARAESSYLDAIRNPKSSPYLRGRSAAFLGNVLIESGDDPQGFYYLALASLLNAREGDLTATALEDLGYKLYERRELSRAYNYLNVALENAVISGNKVEAMRIAEALPALSNEFQKQYVFRVRSLLVITIGLLIALILIIWGLTRERKNNKRLDSLRKQLHQSDRLKEAAIANFLGLCIIYMERLEDFARMVRRKITAGQVDGLFDSLKSGRVSDDGNKVVNEVFDTAFTRMYPDFVERVNALLLPDKRILTPGPTVLNTELRVIAFMRLGVDDTQQVARILGLSVNTVYTYRNKMRARAASRESFESDVMKISDFGQE